MRDDQNKVQIAKRTSWNSPLENEAFGTLGTLWNPWNRCLASRSIHARAAEISGAPRSGIRERQAHLVGDDVVDAEYAPAVGETKSMNGYGRAVAFIDTAPASIDGSGFREELIFICQRPSLCAA